jgi:hypothetical protein
MQQEHAVRERSCRVRENQRLCCRKKGVREVDGSQQSTARLQEYDATKMSA